jgi:hypothetical protein
VAFLRRVLYLDALRSGVAGLALLSVPRFWLVDLFDQPAYPDYALVRILGFALLSLALLMVLVGHRVEEVWWWSWAFVALELGRAVVTTLHALFGLSAQTGALLWWLVAAVSWVFVAGYVWGLARAGSEAPPR